MSNSLYENVGPQSEAGGCTREQVGLHLFERTQKPEIHPMNKDRRLAFQLQEAGFPLSACGSGENPGPEEESRPSDVRYPSLEQLITESEGRLQSLTYRKEFGEWIACDDNGVEYATSTSLWDAVARFWLNTHRALDLGSYSPNPIPTCRSD